MLPSYNPNARGWADFRVVSGFIQGDASREPGHAAVERARLSLAAREKAHSGWNWADCKCASDSAGSRSASMVQRYSVAKPLVTVMACLLGIN